MARYHTTIHSRRRAQETFEYLSDFSTTAEWDPGVVEAERVSSGPVGLGSAFRVVASFLGRRVSLDYRVVEFEPNRRVVLRADAPTVCSVDEITVVPTDVGSVVTYDADLRVRGLFRLADPLLALAFRRIGDRARDGLVRALAAA
ncbi:MAG TPA: SRPBCC family protein [Acidimicrobiales bacterium]|nr:SRPBCC family protein [Acidimicrobiales bacterium]